MATPQSYQCEFLDSIPEDFHCKQCSQVARELTITSCCGESYCKACIHSIQRDNEPCPKCGEESFETFKQTKLQRKILSFRVYCSLKERGCGWCGALKHLDAHLHPDTGECEYTDVHCPFKCGNKIARNKINDHTANECVKRDYVCPYCAFKATYETVSEIHWPECNSYPLPCANHCGVSCERPTMEIHIKICPLQQVECEFKHFGCHESFRREEEEEHMRVKTQAHLTMMATAFVKMNQELQRKLQEQEEKFKEQMRTLQESQGRELKESAMKQLQKQEEEFNKKFLKQEEEFEDKLQEQQTRIQELETREVNDEIEIKNLARHCGMYWKFTMESFSKEKAMDKCDKWKSPAMYTHLCGYKFRIGIYANGRPYTDFIGKSVSIFMMALKGEYDDQLKLPATAGVTVELINHFENGQNRRITGSLTWGELTCAFHSELIAHAELPYNSAKRTHFLKDDTLHFQIIDIVFQ